MTMEIREFQIEAYEDVFQLWTRCELGSLGKSDSKEEINKFLIRNPQTSLVGVVDGRVVASVLGGYDGRRGLIHHLAVDPQCQNKGYGSIILRFLENRFREIGVLRVSFWVLQSNINVVEFYEKNDYQLRDDIVTMSKDLI